MVQDTAARKWLGIGIVSWGSACDPGAPYGVYGRVSQFNQWIERNLSGVWECKD
jgi:secreted trypsin-like serine protease